MKGSLQKKNNMTKKSETKLDSHLKALDCVERGGKKKTSFAKVAPPDVPVRFSFAIAVARCGGDRKLDYIKHAKAD